MAFTSIPEYSTTSGSNTDVNGVSIAEGFPAANINNSIRQLLAQLKTECALGSDVASASTVDISKTHACRITGTTTITAFTVTDGTTRFLSFADALTLTHDDTTLICPGGDDITTAAGDCCIVEGIGTNEARIVNYMRASGQPVVVPETPLPTKFVSGIELSNNATDANNDIDISAGSVRDSTDAENIVLASALTKRLDASWTVGTNEGGLDTGTKANSTWYHVWLIKRSDTGVVDALFSTSATAPTMPTSYDYKRRIGSVLTDSSGNIVAFVQRGDGRNREFWWSSPTVDFDAANPGTGAVSRSLRTPAGVRTKATLNLGCYAGTGGHTAYVSDLATADLGPTAFGTATASAPGASMATIGTVNLWAWAEKQIWTDTSSQIRTRISASVAASRIAAVTIGWMENL